MFSPNHLSRWQYHQHWQQALHWRACRRCAATADPRRRGLRSSLQWLIASLRDCIPASFGWTCLQFNNYKSEQMMVISCWYAMQPHTATYKPHAKSTLWHDGCRCCRSTPLSAGENATCVACAGPQCHTKSCTYINEETSKQTTIEQILPLIINNHVTYLLMKHHIYKQTFESIFTTI